MTAPNVGPSLGERGFTLVELLAAMVGAALLLGALAAMTGSLGNRLQDRRAGPDLLAAQSSLNALATRVLPADASDGANTPLLPLALRLQPTAASGSAMPISATLLVDARSDGAALVLRPEGRPDSSGDQLITNGWRDIRLQPQWRRAAATDPEAPAILAAIIVDLTAHNGGRHQLAAATRLDSPSACVFDPIAQACRP